ncbi:MAG: NAD(P)-dependent oxidoreductase [Minisyncoccia bacterium]|jgi:dTDP-6-deoxy-L-talose 4-dehydrogenase (NAD+)
MRIFVTGGTGFVGKHVVAELRKRGHKLLILSRQKTKSGPRSTFLRGDLSSITKWQGKLARFKPQAAIHMAWEGIPDYGPEMSLKNFSQGVALIRALGEAGCKKVVAVGSCWEYGRDSGKIGEDTDPRPTSAFSAAKTALHWLGRETAKEYGMEFVWARIFYVYGPGQKASSLIPHLIADKRVGTLPVVKNPNGGNDFVYVGDVACALRMLIEKKTPHGIYNIGAGRVTGVREVARAVYGKDVIARKGLARGFYADIARIKKDVGWKPSVSITAGVRAMMDVLS